ncbi:MAG: polysaccharide biosynthesis/export family protein [Thermodesulfobacteriota bacterium]
MTARVILFLVGLACLAVAPPLARADDYLLATGDVVEISIWGEKDMIREAVVRPDGKISYPLIGDLEVAGRNTVEVRAMVEKRIRDLIPDARATVVVSRLDSMEYFVLGKVARPGMFRSVRELSVLQALALAGGPVTFAAEDRIMIMRRQGYGTAVLPFDYVAVKEGKKLEQNITLERGDVVLVP